MRATAAFVAVALLAAACAQVASAATRQLQAPMVPDLSYEHAPGEVVVKYRDDVVEPAKANARARNGLERAQRAHVAAQTELLRFGSAQKVADVLAKLSRDPAVQYAEPNYVYRNCSLTEPRVTDGTLWGMLGGAGGSNAMEAWKAGYTGSGTDVYIGVIDTGIQVGLLAPRLPLGCRVLSSDTSHRSSSWLRGARATASTHACCCRAVRAPSCISSTTPT